MVLTSKTSLPEKRELFPFSRGKNCWSIDIALIYDSRKHLCKLFFFDEWWYFVVCIIIDLGVACGHTIYLFIYLFWCHFVSIYVHVLWINQKLCSWTNCGHINYCLCHYVSLNVHLQWQVFLLQFFWALNLGV